MRLASGRTLADEIAWRTGGEDRPHTIRWLLAQDVADEWNKTYSGDRVIGDKPQILKGSIELAGRKYVCMSATSSGRAGIMELGMVELLLPHEWPHAQPIHYYDRNHNTYLKTWGRGYYGTGYYRLPRNPQDYVLGWKWQAVASKHVPPGSVININQGDLFTPERPYPEDLWD